MRLIHLLTYTIALSAVLLPSLAKADNSGVIRVTCLFQDDIYKNATITIGAKTDECPKAEFILEAGTYTVDIVKPLGDGSKLEFHKNIKLSSGTIFRVEAELQTIYYEDYYWNRAKTGNIDDIKMYIDKFNKGKYITEANKLLEKSYFNVIKDDDINSIDQYIKLYPKGPNIQKALESREKYYFTKIASDGIPAIDIYLAKFPNGKYVQEAKNNREELIFNSIKDNDLDGVQKYLSDYPKGRFNKEAKLKLENILYHNSVNLKSSNSYKSKLAAEEYLKNFPQGLYSSEMRSTVDAYNSYSRWKDSPQPIKFYIAYIKKYSGIFPNIDSIAEYNIYQNIVQSPTKEDINNFITTFPNSRYIDETKQMLTFSNITYCGEIPISSNDNKGLVETKSYCIINSENHKFLKQLPTLKKGDQIESCTVMKNNNNSSYDLSQQISKEDLIKEIDYKQGKFYNGNKNSVLGFMRNTMHYGNFSDIIPIGESHGGDIALTCNIQIIG